MEHDGLQYTFRPNWLHKPFDNPKVRRALLYALNLEDFLKALLSRRGHSREGREVAANTLSAHSQRASNQTQA
jgi:ABC-type oligopeptide transport system substrate-binding subunit